MWVQYSSMSVISKMVPAGGDKATMEAIMQGTIIFGIVIGVIWMVVLIGFYIWSRIYLNKPPIRALFGATN